MRQRPPGRSPQGLSGSCRRARQSAVKVEDQASVLLPRSELKRGRPRPLIHGHGRDGIGAPISPRQARRRHILRLSYRLPKPIPRLADRGFFPTPHRCSRSRAQASMLSAAASISIQDKLVGFRSPRRVKDTSAPFSSLKAPVPPRLRHRRPNETLRGTERSQNTRSRSVDGIRRRR